MVEGEDFLQLYIESNRPTEVKVSAGRVVVVKDRVCEVHLRNFLVSLSPQGRSYVTYTNRNKCLDSVTLVR